MSELKPCAWCGSTEISYDYTRDAGWYRCDKCTACGPYIDMPGLVEGARENAAALWNRRPTVADQASAELTPDLFAVKLKALCDEAKKAVREQVIEEAANVCERESNDPPLDDTDGFMNGCIACLNAIRALSEKS